MSKKLDNKELENVNGGTLAPALTGRVYKCKDCKSKWETNDVPTVCPECGSNNITEC